MSLKSSVLKKPPVLIISEDKDETLKKLLKSKENNHFPSIYIKILKFDFSVLEL